MAKLGESATKVVRAKPPELQRWNIIVGVYPSGKSKLPFTGVLSGPEGLA